MKPRWSSFSIQRWRCIVLTSRLFGRMDFEAPFDIKLRSMEYGKRSFIGYSLADINMRYLLYKLQNLWQDSPQRHQRPKSYILMEYVRSGIPEISRSKQY